MFRVFESQSSKQFQRVLVGRHALSSKIGPGTKCTRLFQRRNCWKALLKLPQLHQKPRRQPRPSSAMLSRDREKDTTESRATLVASVYQPRHVESLANTTLCAGRRQRTSTAVIVGYPKRTLSESIGLNDLHRFSERDNDIHTHTRLD